MLTLITTPKPLDVHSNRLAFCNAIRSWRRMQPTPQILVFGGDEKIITDEGGQYVPIANPATANGHPFFNNFIRDGEALSKNGIMMYVTDHLILTYDVMPTLEIIDAKFASNFVMVGRRWDIDIDYSLDFDNGNWANIIRQKAQRYGKYQSVGTKDYIAFRKPFPLEIPPFVVGYPWYDTWMTVAALRANIPVIDASRTIFTIHQNHTFREGTISDRENTPQTHRNAQLAYGMDHQGHTTHATYMTTQFAVYNREQFKREENAQ